MATILECPLSKSKTKTHAIKVDMTPMVDLGFLLITFFIFTTTLMQPAVTKLLMPKEGIVPMNVDENTLLTAIVDKGKVTVYDGALDKAVAASDIVQTDYNVKRGLGHLIDKSKKILNQPIKKRNSWLLSNHCHQLPTRM